MSVLIATPLRLMTPNHFIAKYFDNLRKIQYDGPLSYGFFVNNYMVSELYLGNALARNALLDRFLKDEEYVFWVDVDIISFPSDIITKLVVHQKDVVGVLVCHADGTFHDIGGFIKDGKWFRTEPPFFLGPHDRLIELDSVGSCYLARSEIYKKGCRYDPHYDVRLNRVPINVPEHQHCMAQAKRLGYRIWLDPTVTVIHQD